MRGAGEPAKHGADPTRASSWASTNVHDVRHPNVVNVSQVNAGLLIRGARLYGKSTWLERELRKTIQQLGSGTALYLNSDELTDVQALIEAIRSLVPLYRTDAPVRRLFIDEITAIRDWERVLDASRRGASPGAQRSPGAHVLPVHSDLVRPSSIASAASGSAQLACSLICSPAAAD